MWSVVCEPVDDTGPGGVNRSALAIMLTDGSARVEAVRVGLVRRNTKNPDTEFVEQLQAELDKAHEMAITINELDAELDLQRIEAEAEAAKKAREAEAAAVKEARERIKEIFGRQGVVPA